MSKELPYFRFTPSEWQNGDISLESLEIQGLFINICSYYWIKDCSITKAKLEQRFSSAKNMIKVLLESDIIEHDQKTDFISIQFLNEQFDQLSELRKHRQEAGSKGGKQKASKAKAKLKQKSSYKDKDNNKDNNKKKVMIVYPYTDDRFIKKWDEWKEYKASQFSFKYKSESTEQTALNSLYKLAGKSVEVALKIIDQSIASGWKGFFQLKNKDIMAIESKIRNTEVVEYAGVMMPLVQVKVDKEFKIEWLDMMGQKMPQWFKDKIDDRG